MYFDNAATSSFKPRQVTSALIKQLHSAGSASRSSGGAGLAANLLCYDVKESAKTYFGATKKHAIITSGCTEALNLAILGMSYPIEAHVMTTCLEHNSVLRPLYHLESIGRIKLQILYPEGEGGVTPTQIEKQITRNTALVVYSACSNVTGTIQNVAGTGEICRKHSVPLLVDAAQAAGHIDIDCDACGIDMLAFPAHKGLNASQGVGMLLTNKRIRLAPIRFGGTGTDSTSRTQPSTMPEGLEAGTQNHVGLAGLGAAFLWHVTHDKEYRAYIRMLSEYIYDGLSEIPRIKLYSKRGSDIVAFAVFGIDSATFAEKLATVSIITRSGLHCAPLMHRHLGTMSSGLVRISCGYDNTVRECKRLVEYVKQFAAK